ncbi:MAG: hypothetical protein KJ882_05600, partial [Proteobacteria bacterium]|nr:hypothetical protein [Pseudomonadota bacterium]
NEVAKVAEAYQKEMKSEGWSEKATMNFGEQSVFVYEKESRIANIAIASTDGKTHITLTIGKN